MPRCNPYGYGTDAGPKHLMGGFYGPEYAGDQTVLPDGVHGPAICERPATVRARMVCAFDHMGPIMDLCQQHARELQSRMSDCCTRCVWPEAARGLDQDMNGVMRNMAQAREDGDLQRLHALNSSLDDLRHAMDELRDKGVIRKVPLTLIEISLWPG